MHVLGATCNIGIGRAMTCLVEQSRTRFFLFLEDDWVFAPPLRLPPLYMCAYTNYVCVCVCVYIYMYM